MKLFNKLGQSGAAHFVALAVVVVGLAAGGTYALVASHANPPSGKGGGGGGSSTGTELYFFQDYNSIASQSGVTIVTDNLNMIEASGSQVQVMQIAPGGSLGFGGKGGRVDNAPALISGKRCFVLRPVGGSGSVNIPNYSGGSQTFALKAAPTPDLGNYWQNICFSFTSYSGTAIPYAIKNTGTTPVNLYQLQFHDTFNY